MNIYIGLGAVKMEKKVVMVVVEVRGRKERIR